MESGSRAWGFASQDSDYDVRFIYLYPTDRYLSLSDPPDSIVFTEGLLDFSGWDLKKALHLLAKSNSDLAGWCMSPIKYQVRFDLDNIILSYILKHFDAVSFGYHNLSIAKNTYRRYMEDSTCSGKKYFYALRPLLNLCYISKYNAPPVIDFDTLLDLVSDTQYLGEKYIEAIRKLLYWKRDRKEGDTYYDPLLHLWVRTNIEVFNEWLKTAGHAKQNMDRINYIFRSMLAESVLALDT